LFGHRRATRSIGQSNLAPLYAIDRFHPTQPEGQRCQETPSRLVFVVERSHIIFARHVAFGQDAIYTCEVIIALPRALNGPGLEFNPASFWQFNRFKRSKHPSFKNCMNCLHRAQYNALKPP